VLVTPVPRTPSPADPLRVLVVGDSLSVELSLPVEYALESGGAATVDRASVPSLPRDPGYTTLWHDALATYRPELVIVLIGYWEVQVLRAQYHDQLPPQADYVREHLAPFAHDAADAGASILWVGPPQVRDVTQAPFFTELSQRFAAFAAEAPTVSYVDGNPPVAAPDGSFQEIAAGPNGAQRVRWADGLHLCPDGAERVAVPVLDEIQARWHVPVGADWQDGPWRTGVFSGQESCPPA
jgi:hypothetical protein